MTGMETTLSFTGARQGCSSAQIAGLAITLQAYVNNGAQAFRHGCCVGADREAHAIALELGLSIHGHPGDDTQAAWAEGRQHEFHSIRSPMDYLRRNKIMVDASDLLIACPAGEEVRRSGTWATIRHCRRTKKGLIIVGPDGVVREEVALT